MAKFLVGFAGQFVSLSLQNTQVEDLILPWVQYRPWSGNKPTVGEFRVDQNPNTGTLLLSLNEESIYAGPSISNVIALLSREVIAKCVESFSGGLALHAGAVSWKQDAIIFPGVSGVGKTSLTAWLVSHGFHYLTDEALTLDSDQMLVEGFNRPMNVKAGGLEAIQSMVTKPFRAICTDLNEGVILVSPEMLGGTSMKNLARLQMIVFPNFIAGSAYSFTKLSAAQTAQELLATLINARNLAAKGLDPVSLLARKIQGFRLQYGEFTQLLGLDQQLRELIETDSSTC